MTNTDRAFIDAYRRAATPAHTDDSLSHSAHRSSGPHFAVRPAQIESRRRVPLSELIAERRETSLLSASPAATVVTGYTWPATALRLADEHARPLSSVLTTLGESVVTLVGARTGVGVTTVALALAKAAASAGLRVTIIDCNPVASDLALAMGVGRLRTLAETVENAEGPGAAMAADEDKRVSIAIGGGPVSSGAARRQLAALAEGADLVVVDAGCVTADAAEPPTAWLRAANSVTVVADSDNASHRGRALETLAAARVAVNGVVEIQTPNA